jgi:hypothetical protein
MLDMVLELRHEPGGGVLVEGHSLAAEALSQRRGDRCALRVSVPVPVRRAHSYVPTACFEQGHRRAKFCSAYGTAAAEAEKPADGLLELKWLYLGCLS